MALSYATGRIRAPSSDALGTVYTVSGLSFQPKALRFYWSGIDSGSAAVNNQSERRGVGFAVSTSNRRCVGTFSAEASAAADCGSFAANDCVVGTVDGSGARDGELDLNSITSDGFTLIVDDVLPIGISVFWEAWGGTDITVANIVDIAEPAATGNVDYTVTGFTSGATDQVVMFAGVQSVSALNTGEAQDSGLHVGFAASTTAADNVTVCGNSDDGSATMDTDGYCQDGECVSMIVVAGGNPNARATLTAFGTDNFRLNWAARALTNRRTIALAIKGGNWKSGALTIAGNSLSATATVSGLSFAPVGMSLIGRNTAENTSATATANDKMAFGSGTSTSDRYTAGIWDTDALGTSIVLVSWSDLSVLQYPLSSGVEGTSYDINAMNSDGFQLIVDKAGGVASEFIGYLTFGSNAAAGNISITGSSGTLKYAGQTSTVLTTANQSITASSGALRYTGQTPTVFTTNRVDISAVSGAIRYAGNTPTVARTTDVYIAASSGAILYSGNTATIAQTANVSITALSGAIRYSGNTATVSTTAGANIDIAAVSGAIVFAGNTATVALTQNQAINALSGAITYSGNTATVTQTANQSIGALSGAIRYSGNTATVARTANQSITALSGAITYQGNTAAVVTTAGIVINALSGGITYTGNTATVQQTANIEIEAVSGQILYGGFPAEVTQSDAVVDVKHGGDDRPRRRQHRGFDLKLWKEQRKPYEDIDRTIEELYAELTGKDSPQEVRQAAQNAVAEYVDTGTPLAPNEPPVFKINWDALITDLRAMEAMRAAHHERQGHLLDAQDMEDLQCL